MADILPLSPRSARSRYTVQFQVFGTGNPHSAMSNFANNFGDRFNVQNAP
jgi:hypothetical protein